MSQTLPVVPQGTTEVTGVALEEEISQADAPRANGSLDIPRPPTQDDLPYSDGIPMESHWHVLQLILLTQPLTHHWADRQDFFVGGNMFVYFNLQQLRTRDFRGPDVFVVLDVPWRIRKSWVVWEEGKGPDVVIELLSESTADADRTTKKQVYQDQLRVPEYFWYDPETGEFAGFVLHDGRYQAMVPDSDGALPSPQLGLRLVRWHGTFERLEAEWLRWATPDGELLPTPAERAAQAALRAQEETRRADEETRRAERLAEKLRALGVDPDV